MATAASADEHPEGHIQGNGVRARAASSVRPRRTAVRLGTLSRRTLAILQRSTTVLRRGLKGRRHRVSVRVTFQRGSGAPSVVLTRNVTRCAARGPDFTG
jgi:hypothetical protein